MKLEIYTVVERFDPEITFSNEIMFTIFDKLCYNPIFKDWREMQINRFNEEYDDFDYQKIVKAIKSPKKDLAIFCRAKECELLFSRNKKFYSFSLKFTKDLLIDKVNLFQDYMIELTLYMPNFEKLTGSAGMEIIDAQKRHNLPQEKSIFMSMQWLNVLSPLGYKKYYEKEDLLSAPFYDVREIAPDIVFIQAYKDPFNVDNEESLNYLRNGINHLNKNLLFFKYK